MSAFDLSASRAVSAAARACVRAVSTSRGELVDRGRKGGDGLQRAVLAPAGDIWDRFPADVQANAGRRHMRGRVDNHFGSLATVVRISDPECVDRLVDQDPQLPVGGLA